MVKIGLKGRIIEVCLCFLVPNLCLGMEREPWIYNHRCLRLSLPGLEHLSVSHKGIKIPPCP